ERQPHHHRHADRPAEHEVDLGRLVDQLVHGVGGEVGELQLGHRPHAAQGGADGRAHDRLLGDRGVADPLLPEAVQHPGGHPERAPVDADVLARHADPLVGLHGLGQGGPDGLGEGHGLDLGFLGGGHGASASSLVPAAAATGPTPASAPGGGAPARGGGGGARPPRGGGEGGAGGAGGGGGAALRGPDGVADGVAGLV